MLKPACLPHLLLVEFRWLPTLYYSWFMLILGVKKFGDQKEYSPKLQPFTSCAGVKSFNSEISEASYSMMWAAEVDYEAKVNECVADGCDISDAYNNGLFEEDANGKKCSDTSPSGCTGDDCKTPCCLSMKDPKQSSKVVYLNIIAFVTTMPVYLLLSIFIFITGEGSLDDENDGLQKYCIRLHNIKDSKGFRVYTKVVLLVFVAMVFYGMSQETEHAGELLVSAIVGFKLVPSAKKKSFKAIKINKKDIQKKAKGLLKKFEELLNFDSDRWIEEGFEAANNELFGELQNIVEIPCINA